MKKISIIFTCMALYLSCITPSAAITDRKQATIDWLNANIEQGIGTLDVKPSCLASDGSAIRNCISDGYSLNVWLDEIRRPDATNPLKVDIAPGSYRQMYIRMNCAANGYTGHTSFIGSGATVTSLTVNQNPVNISNCTKLNFSDFAIYTFYHYINWTGGGESRWDNMDINTQGGSWREHGCIAERGKHYWYSSKLSFGAAGNGLGYSATCDETWFYGSEIAFGSPFYAHQNGHALLADGAGEIHVYGGNISGSNTKALDSAIIKVSNNGKIHIHGTGIDLKPNATAMGISNVFKAESGGKIHANSNAYAIDFAVDSQIVRINELGGSVTAPYNWGALIDPPAVMSKTGSDTVTETDCSPSVCDDMGSQPHILVSDNSCAANAGGPWLDTMTRKCRGEL